MIKKTFTISILLVVLAALSFISCKTQPTAVSDFQVIEEIPNTTPTPTDTNGSTNINITIDNSKGLSQFAVSHYKSGNYSVNGNVAYYYATVSNNCIIVGAKYTNGTVLEENANMYLMDSSQTGATYSLKGTRFSQKNENTATATFTADGHLIIKFSNVSSEIIYSLQSKSEDNNQNIDDSNGFTRSQLVGRWDVGAQGWDYIDYNTNNGVMFFYGDDTVLWQGSPSIFSNEKIAEFKILDLTSRRINLWGFDTASYILTSPSNMTRILSNSSSGYSETYYMTKHR